MENNTIFFREKKDCNYTVINNTVLKDERLSWKAKGLFCYLLSLPEDWNICLNDLQNRAKDGIDGLKSAIKELKEYGYLIQKRNKDEKGRFLKTIYIIVENPQVENPQLLNTNIQNTNLKSTNIQSTKRESKHFTIPTLEEIQNYCNERKNKINPEYFLDYYTARDWKFNNGGKMKDWKATIRNWERLEKNREQQQNKKSVFDENKLTFD